MHYTPHYMFVPGMPGAICDLSRAAGGAWERVCAAAPWSPRAMHAACGFRGALYVAGGADPFALVRSAVEEVEGLGPRKVLFALLGGAVTRSWTPSATLPRFLHVGNASRGRVR